MRRQDSIRTTHVGSLPRSEGLRELLEDGNRGDEFENVASDAVEEAVRRQDEVGLDAINDGEQSRVRFHTYVAEHLQGYSGEAGPPMWADLADYPDYAAEAFGDAEDPKQVLVEPVEYAGEKSLRRDIERLQTAVDAVEPEAEELFYTAPSPGIVATTSVDEQYGDPDEFLFALADALGEEYAIIADEGLTLQVDAPDLLADAHRAYRDRSTDQFLDQIRTHVRALNEALGDVPVDQVRLHTCWGNYEGPHHHDVALETVLPVLYEADVGGLVVEGSNPRHEHEYRAFEEHSLPEGWTLTAGVVDVKTNFVEHPETVADRIERFADAVGDPSRVAAAPDCGFETMSRLNNVYPDIVWEKLEALVEGADLATDRLF